MIRSYLAIVLVCFIIQCSAFEIEISSLNAENVTAVTKEPLLGEDDEIIAILPPIIPEWEKPEPVDVPDVLITTSPLWVSNTRETVCVSYLEGPTKLAITVRNYYSWTTAFSLSKNESFPEGGSRCFDIQVPDIEIRYSTSANMIVNFETEGRRFRKEIRITIYGEQLETYIQTDKPKYKPGQEVKFRMLSIKSPSMKVVKQTIPSVIVESPNGLRIMQWDNVKADEGLVDLQFQLSDEPMLGRWKITARVGNRPVIQSFEVEEYVLPKFEVLTETPSAIYIRDKSFKMKVCGVYTYGQPVRGSVNATLCFKYSWRDCVPETTVVKYSEDTGVDGCSEFEVTSEELKWDISQYYYGGRQLSVNANFTEEGTDITLSGSSLSTTIKNTAVSIQLEGLDNFKPGFEYHGKVVVTNVDGSSADGINLTIAVREKYNSVENIHFFNYFTENGVAKFSFDAPIDTAISSLYIKVTAEGYETDSTFDDFYGYYRIRYNPSGTKQLQAFYSPSGSFLMINPVQNVLNFGSEHTFNIDYTVPAGDSQIIQLKYIVMARSSVISSGKMDVNAPSCTRKGKRSSPPIIGIIDYEYDLPDMPDQEELVIGLEPLPLNCRFSFSLPIEIKPEMSPDAKLLIYYARKDDEVIADSLSFQVTKGLSTPVALEFEHEETRPGETTTLTVQSEANSLCAVGIVDKSVELLGTTNQLTNEKVFQSLSRYSYGYFYYPLTTCKRSLFPEDEDTDEPPPTVPTTRKGYTLTTSKYTTTKHADSVTVFTNAGVAFATSLDVETRPCYQIKNYYWRRDYPYYYSPRGGISGIAGPQAGPVAKQFDVAEETDDGGNAGRGRVGAGAVEPEPPVKIRTYFPETLLWQIKRTHQTDGTAEFDLNVPDTITDWKANGFCISPDSNIGISETATLRAFKPFFVSLTLPYSVIRNETIPLKITVFNYLSDKCLMVKVVLKNNAGFTTLGNDFTRKVCVCGGRSKTVQFRIVPHKLGEVPITVTAVTKGFNSGVSKRMCDGSPEAADRKYVGLSDGVQRNLLVEPEGIEKDVTQSSIVCLTDGEDDKSSYEITFPDNTVPDSARVKLQIIGDIMGPALNNLDRLIRLPTGCGEQNIVGMAPNVYVLTYLINTGQADDQTKKRVVFNIESGYQRELNYRRRGGSYSAFGESDEEGSTWLTAFVLRTFAESAQFIRIDSELMEESLRWLELSRNITTGCMISRGRVLHKAMKGGVSDEITLTAYTLITLLEAGGQSSEKFIEDTSNCLVDRWNDVGSGIRDDVYSVALLAYAFKLSGHTLYNEVLDQLDQLAIDEDGLKHWERPDSKVNKDECFYCRAPSAEVEMTAYGLLALDLSVDDNVVEGLKIARWLAQQQNAYGGYSSTQDTVIALKALSYFAEVLYGGETTEMTIKASSLAGGEEQVFQIDASNRLLLQRMDIEKAPTTVEIEATGSGCALVQIQSLYNIYEKPTVAKEPFTIDVESWSPIEKLGCAKQTMKITVSYNGDDGASSMAIVEVKLISGYYADKLSLRKLSKDQTLRKLGFKRYEINNNIVDFYFDEFTAEAISFEFDVDQELVVKNPKPGMITVYDYYEAEMKSVIPYKLSC
ncbi:pregnancy zone protein-like [Antedon mediterranea]|uniref:pregnancy zone protein-like n=1 Tax=Antedon mediterranea TaxID=105859 RepID=UPI003AF4E2B6